MADGICITVMAHNEAGRIRRCLASLPWGRADVIIHVVVNGSSDGTAEIARAVADDTNNIVVHEFSEGGKARSWNRFLFDTLDAFHKYHIFVDGDAEIIPGSIDALVACLEAHPHANAASGLPCNGRRAPHYRQEMEKTHGLFGDLYALRGAFLTVMKEKGIRLPDDLIGDDSLVGAMVKTNLHTEANWQDERVVVCHKAGFLCEPVSLWSPATLHMQKSRMINYSVRRFQNHIVSEIMRRDGPQGLPRLMRSLYAAKLPTLKPRAHPLYWWFDRKALQRMSAQLDG